MSTLTSISASGMNAAQAALDLASHNIANLATPGFRRQQIAQETSATGGVETAPVTADMSGNAPETDLVALLQARTAFQLNLAVFRTGDRMMGSLLDSTG